jgi:hypothetical protein
MVTNNLLIWSNCKYTDICFILSHTWSSSDDRVKKGNDNLCHQLLSAFLFYMCSSSLLPCSLSIAVAISHQLSNKFSFLSTTMFLKRYSFRILCHGHLRKGWSVSSKLVIGFILCVGIINYTFSSAWAPSWPANQPSKHRAFFLFKSISVDSHPGLIFSIILCFHAQIKCLNLMNQVKRNNNRDFAIFFDQWWLGFGV